jgi:endonuclease YncB( thermonuclease family)
LPYWQLSSISLIELTPAEVVYVRRVDGEHTLLLGTGERVRLVGVDTPKSNHPKKPAERFGRKRTPSPGTVTGAPWLTYF